jgi:hypothetical protein
VHSIRLYSYHLIIIQYTTYYIVLQFVHSAHHDHYIHDKSRSIYALILHNSIQDKIAKLTHEELVSVILISLFGYHSMRGTMKNRIYTSSMYTSSIYKEILSDIGEIKYLNLLYYL